MIKINNVNLNVDSKDLMTTQKTINEIVNSYLQSLAQQETSDSKDKIIINKSDLCYLYERALCFDALEAGGVDNWEWYSDCFNEFMTFCEPEYKGERSWGEFVRRMRKDEFNI